MVDILIEKLYNITMTKGGNMKKKNTETKKGIMVYVHPEISQQIKLLAVLLDTSVSALTEEAYKLILEKYSDLFEKKGLKIHVGQE